MSAIDLSLINEAPHHRLDRQLARQTLTFAFATGSGSDPFDRLFAKLARPPSTYSADCFAADLFLESFVEQCLPRRIGPIERRLNTVALRKLIAAPPASYKDVLLRQAVFSELREKPELAAACESTCAQIEQLRIALESSEIRKQFDPIRRRLEILRQFDQLLRTLQTQFATSTTRLRELTTYATEVLEAPGYASIAQLLDYESHLATLEVTVQMDRAGQVRRLQITKQRENTSNPLHFGPWSRFLQRMLAVLRGYPLHEREVVGELVESLFDQVCPALITLFEFRLDLEFYLAFDGFRRKCEEHHLEVCLPKLTSSDDPEPLRLTQLFNPFLVLEAARPVPCDLVLDKNGLVLLTGPNSGGKTRLLQSVGFVQLLAQSGTWVPARSASVPVRTGLFVSLVHEASSDQKEGRLGTELLRIRRLFERLEYDQLVLLDELCSGTNPSEGEEIVELVISLLTKLRPQAIITTHFLQFAERLAAHPPIENLKFLQVSLDPHLHPLYQFVPGVASTSLASQTAERLGVTREALETLIVSKRDQNA